jgi:hypothetical protein
MIREAYLKWADRGSVSHTDSELTRDMSVRQPLNRCISITLDGERLNTKEKVLNWLEWCQRYRDAGVIPGLRGSATGCRASVSGSRSP